MDNEELLFAAKNKDVVKFSEILQKSLRNKIVEKISETKEKIVSGQ